MSVYDVLAEKLGYKGSKYLPKVFEAAANERQARLLGELLASPGPPLTVDVLAQRTGFDAKTIREDLDILWRRGLTFPRNFQKREEWRGPRSSAQIHDSMMSSHMFYPDPERLRQAWREYDENEYYDGWVERDVKRGMPRQRVIPVWESVKDNPNLQPWENWRVIFSKADPISVVDCPCRFEVQGCNKLLRSCIDLNRGAEYDIATGHGTKISVDEAMKVLHDANMTGLMSQGSNWRDVTRSMCNCCSCCCVSWLPFKQRGLPQTTNFAPSRYEARIDQEACTGCQKCVDICPFDECIVMEKVAGAKRMKARVDAEKCYGCGLCFLVCDDKAITMECGRPESHVPVSAPWAPEGQRSRRPGQAPPDET